MRKILLIDDDEDFCQVLRMALAKKGYAVESTSSGSDGIEKLARIRPACVLLDLNLWDTNGLDVLEQIKTRDKNLPVIMLTGHETVSSAVQAMKKGAFHYMPKPIDSEELDVLLEKAVEQRDLYLQLEEMKERLGETDKLEELVGSSEKIQQLTKLVRSVSSTNVNVLLTGESGSGKEVIARVIHHLSSLKAGPFVPIDCASIPETLIESELFGHEKGAFTGATATVKGKLEVADNGTVFLDEVANIPAAIQAKLLRFLERREFERVGSRTPIRATVRIIAASNKDLGTLAKQGGFRPDLYFRLNEFPITVPPLRERRDDIPFLCGKFVSQLAHEMNKEISEIAPEALEKLKLYDYPGNVRELRNIIKRAMVVATQRIEPKDLPPELLKPSRLTAQPGDEITIPIHGSLNLPEASRQTSQEIEKRLILEALRKTEGHQGKAAQLLGITARTLYNKIREFGL